jgi:uroporphyrinogen decarboxylase
MTPREIILEQIHHRETTEVPYTLGVEPEFEERLNAHFGGTTWRQRLKQYMLSVSSVDTNMHVQIDAAHWRDAYGGIWRMDRRPWHLEKPALAQPSFDGYEFPSPDIFKRPEQKAQVTARIAEQPDLFRIGSLGWGLFERSWCLRGFENALVDAITEPDFYEELLDRLQALYLAFVEYTADLPVDAIMFGDDWGDQRGVILGPERWRKMLKPRWAAIYEAVHAHGKLVITHCCGSIAEIMPDIIEIGLDVLESCQPEAAGMNPYELKRAWGDKLTFWGGLGSQSTIPFGTPQEIKAEVRKLQREMSRGGGYILAPAKALQPETPIENAVALIDALTE